MYEPVVVVLCCAELSCCAVRCAVYEPSRMNVRSKVR